MPETNNNFIPYLRLVMLLKYFIGNMHRCPWRSVFDGGLSILRMWVRVQVIAAFFNVFFFPLLILQCDFNINLMPYSVSPKTACIKTDFMLNH